MFGALVIINIAVTVETGTRQRYIHIGAFTCMCTGFDF